MEIPQLGEYTQAQLRSIQATDYIVWTCLRHKHQHHDHQALEEFRARRPQSPSLARLEMELRPKSAVAPGVTTDTTWGAPLALASSVSTGFAGLVHAGTLLGRLPTRTAPLNSLLPVMTTSATAFWTGQALAKAMSALGFGTTTLGFFKPVAMIALSEELVKLAIPGAEVQVRDEVKRALIRFLDGQAFDPAVAEVAGVTAGSLTNGAPSAAATGVTATAAALDVKTLIAAFVAQNADAESLWLLMSPTTAVSVAIATDSSTLTAQGGSLFGINVLTSAAVAGMIVMLDAQQIVVAQEEGIRLDLSTQTTLEFESTPANPTTAATVFQNLWQRGLVALKAEKFISYKRLRTNAVRVLTGVAYV
jgi:hypothetical protein